MHLQEAADLIRDIEITGPMWHPSCPFRLVWNVQDKYLQVAIFTPNNTTRRYELILGRKWRLSEYMTRGEIVQTAFMAALAFQEHELREQFTYKGQSVFEPHYDIDKLAEFRSNPANIKEREPQERNARWRNI